MEDVSRRLHLLCLDTHPSEQPFSSPRGKYSSIINVNLDHNLHRRQSSIGAKFPDMGRCCSARKPATNVVLHELRVYLSRSPVSRFHQLRMKLEPSYPNRGKRQSLHRHVGTTTSPQCIDFTDRKQGTKHVM